MIQRAIIHVGGAPGAGKTAFVERLLAGSRHWVLAVRCRRDPTLRRPREACPARHPELRRYRDAGASAAGLFTFPVGDLVADDLYNTRLMEDSAQAVVLEGDTPVSAVDLRVCVAPPLGPGQTLLIRGSATTPNSNRTSCARSNTGSCTPSASRHWPKRLRNPLHALPARSLSVGLPGSEPTTARRRRP